MSLSLGQGLFKAYLNEGLAAEHDAKLNAPDIIRNENGQSAFEVYQDSEKDSLREGILSREIVLKYLRALKNEYYATRNYNEVVFKN